MKGRDLPGPLARTAWRRYESAFGPNMTPMVDVVMVILVFFMASAAFLGPEWFVKSVLPVQGVAASTGSPVHVYLRCEGATVRVAIDDPLARPASGQIAGQTSGQTAGQVGAQVGAQVGGQDSPLVPSEQVMPVNAGLALNLRRLVSPLKDGGRLLITLVVPEQATPYEMVVEVHEAAMAAGLGSVGIAPPAK